MIDRYGTTETRGEQYQQQQTPTQQSGEQSATQSDLGATPSTRTQSQPPTQQPSQPPTQQPSQPPTQQSPAAVSPSPPQQSAIEQSPQRLSQGASQQFAHGQQPYQNPQAQPGQPAPQAPQPASSVQQPPAAQSPMDPQRQQFSGQIETAGTAHQPAGRPPQTAEQQANQPSQMPGQPAQQPSQTPAQQAHQPPQMAGQQMQPTRSMGVPGTFVSGTGAQIQSGMQQPQLRSATVEQLLQTDVVTVEEDTPVATAVAKMNAEDVGSVVVVDADRRPRGILTDRRVALSLESMPDIGERTVAELTGDELITASIDMTVFDAIQRLSDGEIRRLPIVDESGTLEGIVTLDDITVFLAGELNTVADVIKAQSPRF
ncbi:CBS domain-containing protein [Halobellus sp. GM3]|uniref:CBS domain-containing protein n=1 Tax=Halobellus sp. GM3 TaxID=3458410 RepID=UPI00403DCD55